MSDSEQLLTRAMLVGRPTGADAHRVPERRAAMLRRADLRSRQAGAHAGDGNTTGEGQK